MGNSTFGQVLVGYLREQPEQAIESKSIGSVSSCLCFWLQCSCFKFLPSTMGCNLYDGTSFCSLQLALAIEFITATERKFNASSGASLGLQQYFSNKILFAY